MFDMNNKDVGSDSISKGIVILAKGGSTCHVEGRSLWSRSTPTRNGTEDRRKQNYQDKKVWCFYVIVHSIHTP
jgi:hypothetical protein